MQSTRRAFLMTCHLAALVVLFTAVQTVHATGLNFYAPEAGSRVCSTMPCLSSQGLVDYCAPCGSYILGSTPPFPTTAPKQLVAMPFVYSGNGTFSIQRIKVYYQISASMNWMNAVVFLWQANTTNNRFPGAAIDGTSSLGQVVNFTKVAKQSNDGVWELVGTIPPVNITAGLYYVSVAGYGPSSVYGSLNLVLGWADETPNSAGGYYYAAPAFNGLNSTAISLPFAGQRPTKTWSLIDTLISCVWVEGPEVIVPTPPYLVRYALGSDLDDFVPRNFIDTLTTTLNATLATNASYPLIPSMLDGNVTRVFLVNAGRANATTVPTTNVDFYVTGPNTVGLTKLAYNLTLDTLNSNGVPLLSTPVQLPYQGQQ